MYKRILVPVDGSETSNKALVAALQLARESGGSVRLAHVLEDLTYLAGYEQFGGYSGDLLGIMQEAGNHILHDGVDIAQAAGVQADSVLFDKLGKRLSEVIAGAAREWNADLIVVGTHGRRGVGRALLGSGAEQIIRQAPVPVLVVRSAEDSKTRSG
ncbi:universal stress protein [Polaromonas sp. A23]|uniref:universal stress protein n=1 Tax=Polaromonas sp. A23 TaxID=1944133 RepID=UPI000984F665|nr:universal stress protein [Polaromonas sp. A23]OOG36711.1 universal stress protein UspA [Polaromonas sp. A23]